MRVERRTSGPGSPWRRRGAWVAAALSLSAAAPVGLSAQAISEPPHLDSLLAAARRVAREWRRHDFAALVGASETIVLQLPGADPSAPLGPAQAAELLRAFADGATEIEVEVLVARNVDAERAYVEVQRIYTVRGTAARRSHTLYFGMRRAGASFRVFEVRALP